MFRPCHKSRLHDSSVSLESQLQPDRIRFPADETRMRMRQLFHPRSLRATPESQNPNKLWPYASICDFQLLRNTLGKFFCLGQLETEGGGRFFQVVNQSLPIPLFIKLHALADVGIAVL